MCSFLGLGFLIFVSNGRGQTRYSEKVLLSRELSLRLSAAVEGSELGFLGLRL